MQMKVVATIEARMTSSRLPGKVMLEVNEKSMIRHLVERLKTLASIDEIVLATTLNIQDDVLETEAKDLGITVFRGSEDNVMGRVLKAGEAVKADIIVELTGDCPILDPRIVDESIKIFKKGDYDYVTNIMKATYPDGMATQVFSLSTLKKSYTMTDDRLDLEHVSLHIRNNPIMFRHFNMIAPKHMRWPNLGLTLDEDADFKLIKNIIEHFEPHNKIFSCDEVISYLIANPHLQNINQHIVRKGNT